MNSPMTPFHARMLLTILDRNPESMVSTPTAKHALETLAAMRVEEDWRIVDPETNGGKYEKKRYTRLVGKWTAHE